MDELRIFWKIVVDPACARLNAEENELAKLVRKEVGIWYRDNGDEVWHRHLWESFDLQARLLPVENIEEPSSEIICDRLCLYGKYLEITDSGLQEQVKYLGDKMAAGLVASIPLVADSLASISNGNVPDGHHPQFEKINDKGLYYAGRNIMLEAEFCANDKQLHALFEFPMYDQDAKLGPLVLCERIKAGDKRRAIWKLSSSDSVYCSEQYNVTNRHVLSVNQDRNVLIGYQVDYFEFLLDSIPIRPPVLDRNKHFFSTGEVKFYVGYSPFAVAELGGASLRGCVRRIVFDPNASCLICATKGHVQ